MVTVEKLPPCPPSLMNTFTGVGSLNIVSATSARGCRHIPARSILLNKLFYILQHPSDCLYQKVVCITTKTSKRGKDASLAEKSTRWNLILRVPFPFNWAVP